MEYIVLWILALFGLWSLISNILDSLYFANKEGTFDVILNVHNQEDSIHHLIKQLDRIDVIGKIRIIDNNSTDSTVKIIREIQKNNPRVVLEEIHITM